jgi:hypothetical protein
MKIYSNKNRFYQIGFRGIFGTTLSQNALLISEQAICVAQLNNAQPQYMQNTK